ncbi:hypothetical protein RF11_07169 [Thelohanellus kitauei]|uniref:Uncharacterized protein n=1 Tax=Thelohanellus kitauei TaxID=669202 RepID=A0A0C2N3K1_THEKT|nr:hypothetical protein RF11_07169 [Thelohanellus kitauei]
MSLPLIVDLLGPIDHSCVMKGYYMGLLEIGLRAAMSYACSSVKPKSYVYCPPGEPDLCLLTAEFLWRLLQSLWLSVMDVHKSDMTRTDAMSPYSMILVFRRQDKSNLLKIVNHICDQRL